MILGTTLWKWEAWRCLPGLEWRAVLSLENLKLGQHRAQQFATALTILPQKEQG